jgi:molybdopterin synthase catalytic subunit
MAIVHRIGPVQITEPSVITAVSAVHRDAAFAACRFAIEENKNGADPGKKFMRAAKFDWHHASGLNFSFLAGC